MQQKYLTKLLILCLLIAAGIILQISGSLEPDKLITVAREYSGNRWLIVILILLQVLFFTFALAGSIFLWVAATLYPPVTSTFILVIGATLGGVSAYFFSRRLTEKWIKKVEDSAIYKLLQWENNFFALLALRLIPAFPHALINYSSGILHINLGRFVAAAVLGLSVKSYIFSSVIYQATSSASLSDLLDISTYGPLLLLSGIIGAGVIVRYKMKKNHNS
ncbi:MAG: TVP38/TMEM64 family protein [Gammaproteobacteria bacterium]|nr:MAG: TVP38/TMEM64 family protein [Gammaproteobacteria bacterium]